MRYLVTLPCDKVAREERGGFFGRGLAEMRDEQVSFLGKATLDSINITEMEIILTR